MDTIIRTLRAGGRLTFQEVDSEVGHLRDADGRLVQRVHWRVRDALIALDCIEQDFRRPRSCAALTYRATLVH